MALSWLYDLGIKIGSDGLFYYVIAGSHLAKLVMVVLYGLSGAGKAKALAEAAKEE
jgi:hypothetical protein|eukprot:COSAG06_NODE_5734_length_3301_cov_2.318551_3_plen_56_part_00